MRAYELHCSAKQVQGSRGRSYVAAAAYRAGERIRDERTGLIHNYTRKSGVEHTRLYAPADAPEWAQDRGSLWNEVERRENRSNSMTARELEIAFPHEFNKMQRMEAGDAIATALVDRYGCAIDIAYHKPSSEGDQRNHHAHVLFTTRLIDSEAEDGWAKNKYRDLNRDYIEVDGEPVLKSRHKVEQLRALTAQKINHIAERDGLGVCTEYRSYESRGINREA